MKIINKIVLSIFLLGWATILLTGCSRQSVTDFTPSTEDQARVSVIIDIADDEFDISGENYEFKIEKAELTIEAVEFEHWEDDSDDHHHHHHSLRLNRVLIDDERELFAHRIKGPIEYDLLSPEIIGHLVLHHETHMDIDIDVEEMVIEGTLTEKSSGFQTSVKILIEDHFEFEIHSCQKFDEDSDLIVTLVLDNNKWFNDFDLVSLAQGKTDFVLDKENYPDEIEEFIEAIHELTSVTIDEK